MLKIEDILALIKEIDGSSIDEFTYETDGSKVKLKKNTDQGLNLENRTSTNQVPVQSNNETGMNTSDIAPTHFQESESNSQAVEGHEITSPMVGTFYHSSSPDTEAFVSVGEKVKPDTVVCIVEAMKLFNEIEADVEGEIIEILVANGELVEYGQPLFRVKQN